MITRTLRVAMLLGFAGAVGCQSTGAATTAGGAQSPVIKQKPAAAAAPAAPAPLATSAASRLPHPVRDALAKDRPNATVSRVKARLHPDGMVHYTVTLADEEGVAHVDEYRADGARVNAR